MAVGAGVGLVNADAEAAGAVEEAEDAVVLLAPGAGDWLPQAARASTTRPVVPSASRVRAGEVSREVCTLGC